MIFSVHAQITTSKAATPHQVCVTFSIKEAQNIGQYNVEENSFRRAIESDYESDRSSKLFE